MIPGTTELEVVIRIFAAVENLELTPELREGLIAKTLVRFHDKGNVEMKGGKSNGTD